MNELIWRIGHALFAHEKLFVKLFTWAEADVLDLDVDVRGEAGKADEIPGHVIDLHRFSHVEDEDFPALCVVRCLKNEGYRLRDGHEVTDDALIGDGYRATLRDLLFKEWNHRTV